MSKILNDIVLKLRQQCILAINYKICGQIFWPTALYGKVL